ncbi:MAG: pyridoxamine 5'-phosphate oxidase family protein [Acidobacteria bacterium]|nr:pyridoxamine 5'-phosphate oxidase family protein [Acidobacteriota bacterium]
MAEPYTPSARTRVVREPQLAVYDRAQVYEILDAGFVCYLGFSVAGQPYVIPTSYGRAGDVLYIHGSAASRMLRRLSEGLPVCVSVALVDGLVLARSVFNHSMNYRSVMILGTARIVVNEEEKLRALEVLSEQIIPGRWAEARRPNARELSATFVLSVPIQEFSAKVRTGPPIDDEEDGSFPVWAGVVPLKTIAGEPIPDPYLDEGEAVPNYAKSYSRKGWP